MSQRDRDRLVVLKKAQKKLITQKQAAAELQLTERQATALVGEAEGSRRSRCDAWPARPAFQPASEREDPPEGGADSLSGRVPGLRTDAGQRVSGQQTQPAHRTGNAASGHDRRGAVAQPA